MTFEKLWEEVWRHCDLPNMAKEQLPKSLSEETVNKLLECNLAPKDIAKIVKEVVEKIDHGSIRTIDELISTSLGSYKNGT